MFKGVQASPRLDSAAPARTACVWDCGPLALAGLAAQSQVPQRGPGVPLFVRRGESSARAVSLSLQSAWTAAAALKWLAAQGRGCCTTALHTHPWHFSRSCSCSCSCSRTAPSPHARQQYKCASKSRAGRVRVVLPALEIEALSGLAWLRQREQADQDPNASCTCTSFSASRAIGPAAVVGCR